MTTHTKRWVDKKSRWTQNNLSHHMNDSKPLCFAHLSSLSLHIRSAAFFTLLCCVVLNSSNEKKNCLLSILWAIYLSQCMRCSLHAFVWCLSTKPTTEIEKKKWTLLVIIHENKKNFDDTFNYVVNFILLKNVTRNINIVIPFVFYLTKKHPWSEGRICCVVFFFIEFLSSFPPA